ncbi:hypothetical protein JCM10213v2_001345 [Rhodosporidiobolus nylandii]
MDCHCVLPSRYTATRIVYLQPPPLGISGLPGCISIVTYPCELPNGPGAALRLYTPLPFFVGIVP